jgi:hypothetical protein
MELLVLLVFAALSMTVAVAAAVAVLWSVLSLMAAMQTRATAPLSRTTAPLAARAVADEMPDAARLAA